MEGLGRANIAKRPTTKFGFWTKYRTTINEKEDLKACVIKINTFQTDCFPPSPTSESLVLRPAIDGPNRQRQHEQRGWKHPQPEAQSGLWRRIKTVSRAALRLAAARAARPSPGPGGCGGCGGSLAAPSRRRQSPKQPDCAVRLEPKGAFSVPGAASMPPGAAAGGMRWCSLLLSPALPNPRAAAPSPPRVGAEDGPAGGSQRALAGTSTRSG